MFVRYSQSSLNPRSHTNCRHHSLLARRLTTESNQFDVVVTETLETLTEALEELPDFIPDVPEMFDVSLQLKNIF
jgi:hypothetical protein